MTTSGRALFGAALLLTPAALAAQTPPAGEPPPKEVQPAETRLKFYGFVRADLIVDDSRVDAAQTPTFVLSESAANDDRGTFTLHPRLTRFGIELVGPQLSALGSARLAGRIELDFQNGGRESRATPRYRHAYMTLGWRRASLLIGQTADIIAPLFPSVNADTLMWNAGNLGERRAQVRGSLQAGGAGAQWSLTGGIGLTGAVDQLDLDDNGIRDGEASGVPAVQGRGAFSYPLGTRRLTVGVWGHRSSHATDAPIAGHTDFPGHVVGVDVEVPLAGRFVARGEAWTGRTLSDIRGGIGQAVNRLTGRGIASRGGWAEVGGDVTTRYALFGGVTRDTPDRDDLPAGGRRGNGAWYLVNRFTIRPLVVGADYLRWRTTYVGLPDGTDNRVNAYAIYSF